MKILLLEDTQSKFEYLGEQDIGQADDRCNVAQSSALILFDFNMTITTENLTRGHHVFLEH